MKFEHRLAACAKVAFCLVAIWVISLMLVLGLGHWRMFNADLSLNKFIDGSHLVVMRELKQEKSSSVQGSPSINKLKTVASAGSSVVEKKQNAPLSPAQQEIADRVHTMDQWCRRLHPHKVNVSSLPSEMLSMILVDTKHHLLFCQIPGVAQNDWRRIFIYLTGKVNVTSHLKISAYDAHSKYGGMLKKLSDFKVGERDKIVEESLKVVFVRDPFERLLSTYKNKLQAKYSTYFHQSFGRKMIQRYRKNATARSLKTGDDVKFNEFVRFVLDSEHNSDGPLNEHWERYYKQCHPCVFHYDIVGKFETLVDDTREVLTRSNVLDKLKPPFVADTFRNSEKSLHSVFQTVNQSDLKRLWKIYYPDYNLFSYPYPEVLHTLLQKEFHDY